MSDFEEFKRIYFEFSRCKDSYKERVGEPDEFSSVVGLIVIAFQRLEDTMSIGIIEMLDIDIIKGKILISEMSFTQKVHMFSSLFHELKGTREFNIGNFEMDEFFKEMIKAIMQCQVFRNQIIHSSLLVNFKTDFKIVLQKINSKMKKGLDEKVEDIDIPYLFDINDYIVSISVFVQEFFIGFKKEGDRLQLSDLYEYRV